MAITPSGVVAIETKWHGQAATQAQIGRDIASARASATHTRSILRHLHLAETPIAAVVVVWGPQRVELGASGFTVDGLEVIPGDHLRSWPERQGLQGSFDRIEGQRLRDLLEEFAQTHGPHANRPAAKRSSVGR